MLFLSPKMDVVLSILIIAFYINISTCLYVQNRKKMWRKNRSEVSWDKEVRARIDCSSHKGTFWGDASILKLDRDEPCTII